MRWRWGVFVLLGVLSGCNGAALVRVPVGDGTEAMRVCRPAGAGPFRAMVVEHGTPALAAARTAMRPMPCDSEVARWFLARGYVVAFPLRRGHGDGGVLVESSGPCDQPDFVRAGLCGAVDVAAAVGYVTALPYVRPDDAVVLGVSTGGWATLAYGSLPHPGVSALIDVSGGRGGAAGHSCRPDLLAYSAAYFATTSRTKMLWLYAANDAAFPPPTVAAMTSAYRAAGGAADVVMLPPTGADGHDVFFSPGGSGVWGPSVTAYLDRQ